MCIPTYIPRGRNNIQNPVSRMIIWETIHNKDVSTNCLNRQNIKNMYAFQKYSKLYVVNFEHDSIAEYSNKVHMYINRYILFYFIIFFLYFCLCLYWYEKTKHIQNMCVFLEVKITFNVCVALHVPKMLYNLNNITCLYALDKISDKFRAFSAIY